MSKNKTELSLNEIEKVNGGEGSETKFYGRLIDGQGTPKSDWYGPYDTKEIAETEMASIKNNEPSDYVVHIVESPSKPIDPSYKTVKFNWVD